MKRLALLILIASTAQPHFASQLPATLAETGLWSDPEARTLAPGVLLFEPLHPLWTDGLEKQRWIQLPPGSVIDATNPDDLQFPVGTKVWKNLARNGQPVETRYMELTPGGWLFAAYVWQGDQATLAPPRGYRTTAEVGPGLTHDVPGQFDCGACHYGQKNPLIGFSAIQLLPTPDRDHLDLEALVSAGLMIGLDPALTVPAEAVPEAIGYLHGNCGHCHNRDGALAQLGLDLQLRIADRGLPHAALTSTLNKPASKSARSAPAQLRVAAANPFESQLLQRVNSRDPLAQMPPFGTKVIDKRGVELLTAWIRSLQATNL